MYNPSSNIPPLVLSETERLFGQLHTSSIKRFLTLSRVSLSFTKGTPETYFIASGIVKDGRSHETKIVYKKRFENTETSPLSSNCDCHQWSQESHCSHSASLFAAFLLKNFNEQNYDLDSDSNSSMPPISTYNHFGVNVLEYGTILRNPGELQGASPSSSYSSLQYLLHNKKVIDFPIPENFDGILEVHLCSPDIENPKPLIYFKYQNTDLQTNQEISIFENLYLFDWKAGRVLHLPKEMKSVIQKLRFNLYKYDLNDILQLLESQKEDFYKLFIDDRPLSEITREETFCQITLLPITNKTQLSFDIFFHDQHSNKVPLPSLLSAFCFNDGLLSSFKKKKDAYNFIYELSNDIETKGHAYKKALLSNSKRDRWLTLLELFFNAEEINFYDSTQKILYAYKSVVLLNLIKSLYNNFGELFFRFSNNYSDERYISFQITSSTLIQGLSKFYEEVSPYQISIFYDKNQVLLWNSKVYFERRTTSTKWFDLELNISNDDLEVINKVDIDEGIAITNKGLVLLNQKQKNLLRFMKKYLKDDGGKQVQEGDINKLILPFNRARIFELFELKKLGLEGALTQEELDLCKRLETMEEMPSYDLPEHLNETIRPYQRTGFNWLRFLYENKLGACLADDMGLGKTIQTIAFINSVYSEINHVLIVCPVSILLNWEKEIQQFARGVELHIYHGGSRSIPDNTKVILTSYGVMKKEAETTFADYDFDIFVMDEVQHLKNIRSMGSYAARKIKAQFRICLTGTPVENDLSEFYNIIDLGVPGIWGDLRSITSRSAGRSRLMAKKTAQPFILRRTKGQVLTDLPPKIENNVFLNLTQEELDFYEQTRINIKNRIQASTSRHKYGEILKGLLQLRQSCLWQRPPGESILRSTKLDFLTENMEQILAEGHQAIVFSQFTTYLDIIQQHFAKREWTMARIDGSQTIKRRQSEVERFQGGEAPVFLISLKAGGVGLNLTAASYVFIMDPWWNPAVEAQAIDRAHRIGQKNKLTVYRPIIQNSVEEKVLQLQEIKKKLFTELLPEDDDETFSGKLTMKDFEHLFN